MSVSFVIESSEKERLQEQERQREGKLRECDSESLSLTRLIGY